MGAGAGSQNEDAIWREMWRERRRDDNPISCFLTDMRLVGVEVAADSWVYPGGPARLRPSDDESSVEVRPLSHDCTEWRCLYSAGQKVRIDRGRIVGVYPRDKVTLIKVAFIPSARWVRAG